MVFDKIRIKFNKVNKCAQSDNADAYKDNLTLLTQLEYKLYMLLREGFSKKECAQRLSMRRGDVKTHVKSIYYKLGVNSISELIVKYR